MSEICDLVSSVCNLLFGCRHKHRSRIFSIGRRTYQVCVDCGREFDYSWEEMRITHPVEEQPPAVSHLVRHSLH